MGAEREFDHGMTDRDIALLLADAASEVEIGIAPTQAVIRGGRRRRARRWAVAAVTAVVVAGSTGALAVTGLPGGGGEDRVTPATQRPSLGAPIVVEPYTTTLATGTDAGRPWRVSIDVWPAPRDELEAVATLETMGEYGEFLADVEKPTDLIGKSAYFVHRSVGEERTVITTESYTTAGDRMSGTDLESAAVPLDAGAAGPQRLVIGHVAKTAQEVTCTWKDGTTAVLRPDPNLDPTAQDTGQPAIRAAEGSPYAWFVCLAPQGTAFKSAEVTK